MIYMDNAATSFPKPPEVAEAIQHTLLYPGSVGRGRHWAAERARQQVEETRQAIAALFHIAYPRQIAFTMNITQSLNLALLGILQPGDHVISTNMEHNAVARPLWRLTQQGVEWTRISAEAGLDREALVKAIQPNTRMIVMLSASNVTGDIFPVQEVGRLAQEYGLLFLVDAAQGGGVQDLDVVRDSIDLLAFTGHKGLLGAQGIGGLYVRPGVLLKPILTGGTGSSSELLEQPIFMPDLLENGTLNLPGIAGLKAGVEFIHRVGREKIAQKEQQQRRHLEEGLQAIPGIRVYGSSDRLAVVSFTLRNEDAAAAERYLEQKGGILCRSGLHCAGLAHRALGTLHSGTCRLSPGYFTREEEIETVLRIIRKMAQEKKA